MREVVWKTADNEEPDCLECCRVDGEFDCERLCGPEHGWWGYLRKEIIGEAD